MHWLDLDFDTIPTAGPHFKLMKKNERKKKYK